ncbi:MAG TPA: hypothetical protein VGM56_01805 [Byssovorax sp.]|jgi:expansin (peptidoglycan-binding protein)
MRALFVASLALVGLSIGCGGSSDTSGSGGSGAQSTGDGAIVTSGTSQTTGAGGGELILYGDPYTDGQYNLGPVDYQESQWHNACAPSTKYPASVQAVEGVYLAGLWDGIPDVAGYCDACIWVTTSKGKTAMLRVVTYGDTSTDSLDVSPEAYDLFDEGEYPRTMTWQFAECPDTGPVQYEFQTCSSEWWTSLWVRNARVPLAKVEVKSPNHGSFTELTRGSDGTLTDNSGFGQGTFSIRSTGVDGTVVEDTFAWPAAGLGGAFLTGQANFQ